MLARVLSGAVLGIDAYLVTVEADVASGLPAFTTVGLPQGAVKEGRERVIAGVQNSGYLGRYYQDFRSPWRISNSRGCGCVSKFANFRVP